MMKRIGLVLLCVLVIAGITIMPQAAMAAATGTMTADNANGGLRYTVTVSKFDNKAGWNGRFDVGNAWGTVMTDILNRSGKFIVLGETDMRNAAMREQDLASSGRTAQGSIIPSTGNMTPAQILIRGAITHVQEGTSGGGGAIAIGGFVLGGSKSTAEVNVTMYMVNSTTGQVVASTSVVGKSNSSSTVVGYGNGDVAVGGGVYKNDNVGKAITDAVAQGVQWMTQQLPNITWRGNVVMVRDGQIYINRGSREGVKPGQEFIAGTAEILRDPNTGEVLDVSFTNVARMQVVSVREKIAICELTEGNIGSIEQGMFVQLPQ
jgi:curli biogenesis system outer membrane secretion channel CsgG